MACVARLAYRISQPKACLEPNSSLAGMTQSEYANRSKEDQNLNRVNPNLRTQRGADHLTFATVLTLIAAPVFYLVVFDRKARVEAKTNW